MHFPTLEPLGSVLCLCLSRRPQELQLRAANPVSNMVTLLVIEPTGAHGPLLAQQLRS